MMVIHREHPQTFLVCSGELSLGNILPREFQQDLWIGWERCGR
jgi:hypothetical protein